MPFVYCLLLGVRIYLRSVGRPSAIRSPLRTWYQETLVSPRFSQFDQIPGLCTGRAWQPRVSQPFEGSTPPGVQRPRSTSTTSIKIQARQKPLLLFLRRTQWHAAQQSQTVSTPCDPPAPGGIQNVMFWKAISPEFYWSKFFITVIWSDSLNRLITSDPLENSSELCGERRSCPFQISAKIPKPSETDRRNQGWKGEEWERMWEGRKG